MKKKEIHKHDLSILLDGFIKTGDDKSLAAYITSHSNLPGRRANLELAAAFGDVIEVFTQREPSLLWMLCSGMTGLAADVAPVNTPREFVPFCGAIGMGAIGALSPRHFPTALASLRSSANDPRWRMREAVCFGLQRMLARRGPDVFMALEAWLPDGSLLELRAAAVTVAEPASLQTRKFAVSALQVHRMIIERLHGAPDRDTENFKTLRKALGFSISVVVQATPDQGFAFLAELAASQNPDVLWIVKQNLKKNRLVKHFPRQVNAVHRLIV